jgi:GTPase SAR1 family protein
MKFSLKKGSNDGIFFIAGGEIFGQLSSVFMRGASGVILMYDVNSKASLDNLKTWIEAARSHNGEDVPMVVAGNKIDIANRKVSTIEGQKFADSYGIPFFEISVKDTTNLAELVKLIIASVLLKDPNVRSIKGRPGPILIIRVINMSLVILLGDSAVGKTAFSRRLAGSTVDLSDFDSGNGLTSSQVRTDTSASTSLLGKVWGGFQSVVGYFGGSKSRSTSNAGQVQTPSISVQMPPQKRKVDLNPIIMAQNAEGAWSINASESIKLFGSDLTTQAPQGVKNDAWMTMICIAYLSVVCSQHKSEWELIVQKAENWLKSVGANRNEWNQRAKQLIQQSM